MAPAGVELGAAGQVEGAEHQAQPGAGLAAAHAAAVAQVVLPAQGGDVGRDLVAAQGRRAAQPGQPLGAGFDVGRQGGLGDAVLADGAGARAPFGGEQADPADAVLAQAGACAELGVPQGRDGLPAVAGLAAPHEAAVGLFVLVALQAADVARRRRVKVEAVVDHVGAGPGGVAVPEPGPFGRQAVAPGTAAVPGRKGAVAADLAGADGPLGDVFGGGPVGAVAHGRDGVAAAGAAVREAQQQVAALQVFRLGPRAVVAHQLGGHQQLASVAVAAEGLAAGGEQAAIAVLAEPELREGVLQAAPVVDARRAGGGKVAVLGGINPLAVGDALHQLGHQEVEVHVALAVGVAGHVHRHAHHMGGEVAAVVEVEAAQEVLVGLSVPRVLGDDQAGHGLQGLGRAQQGAVAQLGGGDGAFAGRIGNADQLVLAGSDGDLLEGRDAGGVGCAAEGGRQEGQSAQTAGWGCHVFTPACRPDGRRARSPARRPPGVRQRCDPSPLR